jgi:hypothetical protein
MAVMFQVEAFLAVTPCSIVVGYQRFGIGDLRKVGILPQHCTGSQPTRPGLG